MGSLPLPGEFAVRAERPAERGAFATDEAAGARQPLRRAAAITAAVLALAVLIGLGPAIHRQALALRASGEAYQRERHEAHLRQEEIDRRFRQGVAMLHIREYEYAITAFHRVLALSPKMPEAHVNMGFSLLGIGDHRGARDFFRSALELRPEQANAYFGLALALDGIGDPRGALAAMRTYAHLLSPADPERERALAWQAERQARLDADGTTAVQPSGKPGAR
jgi:Flp pilus assembly protein TadD